MKTRNFKRIIDNRLLTGLAIGMILLFGTLLTETLGLGPPQCPPCFTGPNCNQYVCDPLGACPCPENWSCCNGHCCAPGGSCCDGAAHMNFCCGWLTHCDNGNCCYSQEHGCPGQTFCCPNGYTCHGRNPSGSPICCPPDGEYCPGAPHPLNDCCPPGQYCVGNGRCCPKEPTPWTLCEGSEGTWTCCDPSYCNQTCVNGICRDCGGDPTKCCVNRVCKGPICDNCHSLSDTAYECGHYEDSTTCASDFCIIDVLDTVTCDYHPDSPCPSNCKVEAVTGQPAEWQHKIILNEPNCLTGGDPVHYEDWHKIYSGCVTCSTIIWQNSCETFGCPGTEEYSAPRGDKMACAGNCP